MSGMNEQQANRWRQTRTMGRSKYVMYYGVLTWGVAFTALFTGMEWFTQHAFTPSWLYIRLAVFGIVGFFIGSFRWDAKEKKFKSQ